MYLKAHVAEATDFQISAMSDGSNVLIAKLYHPELGIYDYAASGSISASDFAQYIYVKDYCSHHNKCSSSDHFSDDSVFLNIQKRFTNCHGLPDCLAAQLDPLHLIQVRTSGPEVCGNN